MEMNAQHKLMQHIIRLLKVSEIVIPIGRTSKGNLGLKYSYNRDDFEMIIDAVPLSTKDSLNDENNIELKKMIEKYMFGEIGVQFHSDTLKGIRIPPEMIDDSTTVVTVNKVNKSDYQGNIGEDVTDEMFPPEPKKRGRPKKVV